MPGRTPATGAAARAQAAAGTRVRRAGPLLLLLLPVLGACDSPPPLQPEDRAPVLRIAIPSAGETVFAECRDFTVVGYFTPPLGRPGDVLVELFAGAATSGAPVRALRSRVDPVSGTTPRSALDFAYADGLAWGPAGAVTDPQEMVMTPDLVAVPGGLEDPTNKVVVSHDYFAAVVLGGATRDFATSYEDSLGRAWTDLQAGVYTLRVTGLSGDLAGSADSLRITFGLTDAMLGRFNPQEHKERLLEAAEAAGRRTYIDFFPGFFAHGGYSYEIAGRWMPNNSIEVVNVASGAVVDGVGTARNDVLLYNVSETCATNRIEIGAIAAHGLVDSERTTFQYYAWGEPTLRYVERTTLEPVELRSEIVPMDPSDRLVLTRVEIEPGGREASEAAWDADGDRVLDLAVGDLAGIVLETGDMFAVFGVVSPLPTATTAGALPAQHLAENAVAAIRYVIADAGSGDPVLPAEVRPVGLDRRYDHLHAPDAYAHSVYEFEHEFRPQAAGLTAGSYTVTLHGVDRHGDPVAGSREVFGFTIAGPALATGSFSRTPRSGSLVAATPSP